MERFEKLKLKTAQLAEEIGPINAAMDRVMKLASLCPRALGPQMKSILEELSEEIRIAIERQNVSGIRAIFENCEGRIRELIGN
jgi:hypothetical protein